MATNLQPPAEPKEEARRPGEWLEYNPLIALLLVVLGFGWLAQEFARQSVITAIANLNTYNFLFLTVGLLLHWRPRRFPSAVAYSVPPTTRRLFPFPLYDATPPPSPPAAVF